MLRRFVLLVGVMPALSAHAATDPAPAEAGIVVARLVSNASQIGVYFQRFEVVEVRADAPKRKSYTLAAERGSAILPGGTLRSTVLVGSALPAGRYDVVALRASMGTAVTQADVAGTLPAFEVKPGEVTDLGILVMQPTGGGKAVLFQARDDASAEQLLRHAQFADGAGWSGKPVSRWDGQAGWTPRPFEFGDTSMPLGLVVDVINMKLAADARLAAQNRWTEARSAADYLALAKDATVKLSRPAVAADGTMYFGSTLGQVLRRSPEGTWTRIETGRLAELSAVTLADPALLVTGAEDGFLSSGAADSGPFSVVAQAADAGRILDIRHWPDDSWWIVSRSLEAGQVITAVVAGKPLSALAATAGKSVSQPALPGFWGMPKPYAVPVAGRTKYFLSIPGAELHAFDVASGTWAAPATGKAAPDLASNNSASVLFTANPVKVSSDDGSSWTPRKTSGTPIYLAYFDADNALAMFMTDKLSWQASQQLRSSTDGGQTWHEVGELKNFPCDIRTLSQNDKLRRIICVFRDGGIYSAGMDGQWVMERAVF